MILDKDGHTNAASAPGPRPRPLQARLPMQPYRSAPDNAIKSQRASGTTQSAARQVRDCPNRPESKP